MEMAKVTSKGQITIPVSIRKRLGIREGDKVLFLDTAEGVVMLNPDTLSPGAAPVEHAAAAPPVIPDDAPQITKMTEDDTQAREPAPLTQRTTVAQRATVTQRGTDAQHGTDTAEENQPYDVNRLLDEIRLFRERY